MWELSFVTGCEGETVTKDTQPEIKQLIATIDLKTSNVDNIRCFNERLKGLQFVIMTFTKIFPDVKVVHLQMDNMVVLS